MGIWDNFYEKAKSFFTGEEGTSESSKNGKPRCYYDLLEVERDAAEDEIKKSFKKLALKWHPDKNPGKEEECAAAFILIQQAYEVLSDPQERAFYDKHRENILYQNTDGPDELKDTGIVLDPYMSTSSWRGVFTSEEERLEKFYSVYRDLFHQLAAEEYAYIEDPEERNFPVFGTFNSDYDNVVAPFYAFWLNFTTRRSFAWLDKWNLREAPDRPSARGMEKENRKFREHGRKQRGEEIRKLVEFVRKHDKRVELARHRQNERNAQIQKRVEEKRRQTIRRNLENLEAFEMDEEEQEKHLMDLEQIEAALDAQFGTVQSVIGGGGGESGDGSEVDEEEAAEEIRCIACEKSFKSRKVLESHQRSKKHRQMVELLRTHMQEEDQQLFDEAKEGSTAQEDEEEQQRRGKRKKKKRKGGGGEKEEEKGEEGAEEDKRQEGDKRQEEEDKPGEGCEEGQKMENDGEPIKETATHEQDEEKKTSKKAKKKGTERKNDGQKPREPTSGPLPSECITCGAEFDSKSKLHAHLKESGHAVLKTAASTNTRPTEGGGGKKKGKNKNRE